eukprot:7380270-Prymnesium_polylepis.2
MYRRINSWDVNDGRLSVSPVCSSKLCCGPLNTPWTLLVPDRTGRAHVHTVCLCVLCAAVRGESVTCATLTVPSWQLLGHGVLVARRCARSRHPGVARPGRVQCQWGSASAIPHKVAGPVGSGTIVRA